MPKPHSLTPMNSKPMTSSSSGWVRWHSQAGHEPTLLLSKSTTIPHRASLEILASLQYRSRRGLLRASTTRFVSSTPMLSDKLHSSCMSLRRTVRSSWVLTRRDRLILFSIRVMGRRRLDSRRLGTSLDLLRLRGQSSEWKGKSEGVLFGGWSAWYSFWVGAEQRRRSFRKALGYILT
jgi:hypothetical protein